MPQPPKSPIFTFDAAAHQYFLDGVEIPGVTTILKTAGLCRDYRGFDEATWRGLHVHECCELLDTPTASGCPDLDWNSVYPKWLGYVKAYARFKDDLGFRPELIEYQSYHPTLRFGGTIDRRGVLPSLGDRRAELDIKTGIEEEWHRWQTAGYNLLGQAAWQMDRRGALYLSEDGTYRLVWHDDSADLRVFLAALTITHTKWSTR